MFDKFADITQEDYTARLDNFLYNLIKTPSNTGYVLIHNGKNEKGRLVSGIYFEQTARGHIKFRKDFEDKSYGLDKVNIVFIRAENKEEFEVSLWIVPEGAEKPDYIETKWDFTISLNTKPFKFTTTEWHYEGLSLYPEHLSLKLFAEYLEANPKSRGNFVINALTTKQYNEEKAQIINILVEKYKVDEKRMNFFYVPVKKVSLRYPADYYPQVEVWFLPKRIIKK